MSDMSEFLELLQTIALGLTITAPITGGIAAWIRAKFKCIDKVEKRSKRQSSALVILSNRIDYFMKNNHDDDPNMVKEIESILKDEEGNL